MAATSVRVVPAGGSGGPAVGFGRRARTTGVTVPVGIVVGVEEVLLGVVVGVGAGLLVRVDRGGGDPFDAPVAAAAGPPLVGAGVEQAVMAVTRPPEVVDVGVAALGPVTHDMVGLGEIAGGAAARIRAAAVSGVQHDALIGAGTPLGPPQVQRAPVVVEHRQSDGRGKPCGSDPASAAATHPR